MQAFIKGKEEKISPKAHLNSDLNELNTKSRIGTENLRRIEQIGADNTK